MILTKFVPFFETFSPTATLFHDQVIFSENKPTRSWKTLRRTLAIATNDKHSTARITPIACGQKECITPSIQAQVGTSAHEIGHALGLFHTQTRHDRDSFITLHTQNMLPGWYPQFIKQTERTNYNYNLTYDYGSVMHYGARSVSRNGLPVMVPRDIKYMQTLGSHTISFYEKLMVNLHYGCLGENTAA
ncbi:Astacin (Peptidase M12A) [Parelaphostrongylus tenuis]|uniref:Metalloendopeptidase n=1 Tax=Parelaphostrongylus tenuis TaxID=148309 RepID=A0AAD5MDD8_PARTN|nr:Astacin (Peptidase M12A) [Parelaphostrongylus tenuis]